MDKKTSSDLSTEIENAKKAVAKAESEKAHYDAILEQATAAKNAAKQTEILHETEQENVNTAEKNWREARINQAMANSNLRSARIKLENLENQSATDVQSESTKTDEVDTNAANNEKESSTTELMTVDPKLVATTDSENVKEVAENAASSADENNAIMFDINCFNNNNQFVGMQKVNFSNESMDKNNITFFCGENIPFVLDLENRKLKLDNSNNDYVKITDKNTTGNIPEISIENISMDHEQNLVFSFSGIKTKYRITPFALEMQEDSDKEFVTVKQFDSILNVNLPDNIFEHVKNGNIEIKNLPFQAFEALDKLSKKDSSIDTFKDSKNLLHLIKSNDQIFVARGNKLIPVSAEKCELFKGRNQNNSNKGAFTINIGKGTNIAFDVSSEEVDDIQSFLNEGITEKNSALEVKNYTEYEPRNYHTVKKQSNVGLKTSAEFNLAAENDEVASNSPVTDEPSDSNSPVNENNNSGTNDNNNGSENGNNGENPQSSNAPIIENSANNQTINQEPAASEDSSKNEDNNSNNKSDDKNKNNKEDSKGKDKDKLNHVELGSSFFGLAAGTMAVLLISGAWVNPLAFALFLIFALASSTGATIAYDMKKPNKQKLTKEEKLRIKTHNKQKQLDKITEEACKAEENCRNLEQDCENISDPETLAKLNKRLTKERNKCEKLVNKASKLSSKIDALNEKIDNVVSKNNPNTEETTNATSEITEQNNDSNNLVVEDNGIVYQNGDFFDKDKNTKTAEATPAPSNNAEAAPTAPSNTTETNNTTAPQASDETLARTTESPSQLITDCRKALFDRLNEKENFNIDKSNVFSVASSISSSISSIANIVSSSLLTDEERAFRKACVNLCSAVTAEENTRNSSESSNEEEANSEHDRATDILTSRLKELFDLTNAQSTKTLTVLNKKDSTSTANSDTLEVIK